MEGMSVVVDEMELKRRRPPTPKPAPLPYRTWRSLALLCRHAGSSTAVACPPRRRVTATDQLCGSP
jgi:hypothetical protein